MEGQKAMSDPTLDAGRVGELLRKFGIAFDEVEHEPVATAAQAAFIKDLLPGRGCKCLFLRQGKGHVLVCLPDEKRCDLRALATILGTGRLSFASDSDLERLLGVHPGAVSPLGLLNDREKRVAVFFDRAFEGHNVLVHPLVNTKTLCLPFADLLRLLEENGREPVVIDMP